MERLGAGSAIAMVVGRGLRDGRGGPTWRCQGRGCNWAGQSHFGPTAEGGWAGTRWAELHLAQEHVSSFLFPIFSFIPSLNFINLI